MRKVLVLFNLKSGFGVSAASLFRVIGREWDCEGIDLCYQESKSPEDGKAKARRAVAAGVDTVLIAGGDGMINTIGAELVDTDVALGAIPIGSGNGFARHFGIPLHPQRAAAMLKQGRRQRIDVGLAAGRPFFVTSGLAWDADLVKGLEEMPVRGILPYYLAGFYRLLTYDPQDFRVELDGAPLTFSRPLALTVANLSQYGGGAVIAPDTKPDDGRLTLVAIPRMEVVKLLTQIRRLFDGSIHKVPDIQIYSFRRMVVERVRPDPIQTDGELVEADRRFTIEVKPQALDVIIPKTPPDRRGLWLRGERATLRRKRRAGEQEPPPASEEEAKPVMTNKREENP